MFPETLVVLICTLDQSGSCCAKAVSAVAPNDRIAVKNNTVKKNLRMNVLSLRAGRFYHSSLISEQDDDLFRPRRDGEEPGEQQMSGPINQRHQGNIDHGKM